MTLKQLEAFYWAATCVNFTVAAERVHLSVSSLSKRIAELEASLGVELFDRRVAAIGGAASRLDWAMPYWFGRAERANLVAEARA